MPRAVATILLAVLAAAATACLAADGEPDEAPLRSGSHVRIGLAGRAEPLVGTLLRSDTRGLEIAARGEAEPRTVLWEDVAALEVGRTHEWRGFAAGTLVGVGVTAGLVAAGGGASEDIGFGAAIGGVGAIPGAAAGAMVGARRSPLLGAAAGAAATALLFVALEVAANDPSNDEIPTSAAFLAGAGLGALSGGAAAAVAHESWHPARRPALRVSVLPTRGGGVAGRLTVSF